MRQKCAKNAPKRVVFYWEKRNVPKCVKNESKLCLKRIKNARSTLGGEHLFDDTDQTQCQTFCTRRICRHGHADESVQVLREFRLGKRLRSFVRTLAVAMLQQFPQGHKRRATTLGKSRRAPRRPRRTLEETPTEAPESPLRGKFPRRASRRVVPLGW